MRELLRSKARGIMAARGVCHMNKKRHYVKNGMVFSLPSFFAQHWREVAARG